MRRNRPIYAAALLLVIIVGLATRRYPNLFPAVVAEYAGDALWALSVFMLFGFLFPRAPIIRIALAALATAFSVEFSQLYQAPWIDEVRQTTLGKLTLGSGFLWSDLACYTAGVAAGALTEWVVGRRKPDRSPGAVEQQT